MSLEEDKELQEFMLKEQQKMQFQAQVQRLSDTCWDVCIDKPRDRLDGKTETCLTNCVNRFIDVSLVISGIFQQKLQGS